jgi:thymidylate kinase
VYFRVPIDTALDRLLARRVKLKFYEAGMDLGWSANPTESFRLFQSKVLEEYDRIVASTTCSVIDAAAASPISSGRSAADFRRPGAESDMSDNDSELARTAA